MPAPGDFYHRRMAGPIAGTGAAATLFTVDHNEQWRVMHIHICNTTTSAQTFKLSVNADAAGTRLYDTYSVAAKGAFDWQALSDKSAHIFYSGETMEWNGPSTLTIEVGGVAELAVANPK